MGEENRWQTEADRSVWPHSLGCEPKRRHLHSSWSGWKLEAHPWQTEANRGISQWQQSLGCEPKRRHLHSSWSGWKLAAHPWQTEADRSVWQRRLGCELTRPS